MMYMGDDIPDYNVMKIVGMPVCPLDACEEIKAISRYISDTPGGLGCVRDVVAQVLKAKGEWMDSWKVEINPDGRTEGFCFHLIGCPIAKHAKEHGYADLLPYLCRTDHYLAEVMHARLIRTQIEALGGDCCDYWYVGNESPALEQYKDLEKI